MFSHQRAHHGIKKFYKELAKLRRDKVWMGTREVEAFSYLLNANICSCVETNDRNGHFKGFFWQQVPYVSSRVQLDHNRAIYILNKDQHFFLVTEP